VTSTVHGVSAGTDGREPMVIIAAVLTAAAVGALTAVRVRRSNSSGPLRPIRPNGPVGQARRPVATSPLADIDGPRLEQTDVLVG
jgi:hypothetical protein